MMRAAPAYQKFPTPQASLSAKTNAGVCGQTANSGTLPAILKMFSGR